MSEFDTPETTRELRDMAWALANGQRVVDELERRARSVVHAIDHAAAKGETEVAISDLRYYRDRLVEMIGSEYDDAVESGTTLACGTGKHNLCDGTGTTDEGEFVACNCPCHKGGS